MTKETTLSVPTIGDGVLSKTYNTRYLDGSKPRTTGTAICLSHSVSTYQLNPTTVKRSKCLSNVLESKILEVEPHSVEIEELVVATSATKRFSIHATMFGRFALKEWC